MSSSNGMARIGRCLNHQRQKTATFNVGGGTNKEVYCKKHAEDGMAYVSSKCCCLGLLCTTYSSYNVIGKRAASYCKKHVHDGMINVAREALFT